MVKVAKPGEDPEFTAILVPGDREVDMGRLEASLEPATVELASDEDFKDSDFLVKGYVGPRSFNKKELQVLADPRVAEGTSWITGADEHQHHVVGCVAGRDFTVDGYIEAAEVREGDPAPDGHGTLTLERGIEIGHIFQLGRKYTKAMDVQILDENGKRSVPTMGSYGIGVSRAMAVIVEQGYDDKGLVWPACVAPYHVHVVVANKDKEAQEAAEKLVADLDAAGIEVLFDDRPKVSPGVKFKDAELLGIPYTVVLGRSFKDGEIEFRVRAGETSNIPVDGALDHIVSTVREALAK